MFIYTIEDILVTILLVGLALTYGVVFLWAATKRLMCKHKHTFVRGSTNNEICRDCYTDLGSVGRDKEQK